MTYTKNDIIITPTATNWPELFQAIRERPLMFFYEKNTKYFSTFVAGILFSENISGKGLKEFDFKDFEIWVAGTYNPRRLTLNSFGLASYLETDSKESFGLWFEWYDEYRGYFN